MQREGLDFTETFAPVARYDSLRMLLAHVAKEDLDTVTFDIKSAFLYGDLEEEIFMEVPEGLCVNVSGDASVSASNVVCTLRKSLCGLKQAPHCWNATFRRFLSKFNFKESDADKCIFTGDCKGFRVHLALFVDDGLLVCKSSEVLKYIVCKLRDSFEITIGDSSYFVGLKIYRFRETKSLFITLLVCLLKLVYICKRQIRML